MRNTKKCKRKNQNVNSLHVISNVLRMLKEINKEYRNPIFELNLLFWDYGFTFSCKKWYRKIPIPFIQCPPMVTSCQIIEQYHNQDVVTEADPENFHYLKDLPVLLTFYSRIWFPHEIISLILNPYQPLICPAFLYSIILST